MCGWSDQQYKSCFCVYEVESFERGIELSNKREKLGKSYWVFVICFANICVRSQIVAQTQVEKGDGPNKPSTINF